MDELKPWYKDVPYEEAKRIIKANIRTMSSSFIAVGYYLKHIRAEKMYLEDGYANIWEFAEDLYGIKMSTASRWMAMNSKFSKGGDSPVLDDKFSNFGKSQLQEMFYLTDEQMQQASPEMTAKEIRAIREPEERQIPGQDSILYHQECMSEGMGLENTATASEDDRILEFYYTKFSEEDRRLLAENRPKQLEDSLRRNYGKGNRSGSDRYGFFTCTETVILFQDAGNEIACQMTWRQYVHRLFELMKDPQAVPPGTIPVEDQYRAFYEAMTSPQKAALQRGEKALLTALLYNSYRDSLVRSGSLNYQGTKDGMVFNPDTVKTQVSWPEMAESLIKAFRSGTPVRTASVVEEEPQEEKWTESDAVKRYAKEHPKELGVIMKICRQFTRNGDRAKAVQKHFAPYGWNGSGSLKFERTFKSFSAGVEIASSAEGQKVEMKYGRFVVELLNLYDPYSPEFMEGEEFAPAQEKQETTMEETNRQQETEKPEEWPEDLADIPVPSLTAVNDFLYDAERELKEYLEVEGLPEKVVLKQQLWTAGLRIIKNLVGDISGEGY